jgi:2-polyprenyl-3-methyl-5-hydroxy-6-metoxy-1,4-benzoquinol methylase
VDLAERSSTRTDRHPWERARCAFFSGVLERATDGRSLGRVLDVGAGDGWVAGELVGRFSVSEAVCWDVNYSSADLDEVIDPQVHRVVEPPAGEFDTVLLLDVLEHVERDDEFLDDLVFPRVRAGGLLLVSVPAHPALFSEHDRLLGHHRRYRPAEIARLVHRRFDVVTEGPLFLSLVPARALEVVAERFRPARTRRPTGVGEWRHGPLLTSIASGALAFDGAVSRAAGGTMLASAGLSYWLCCRRPV